MKKSESSELLARHFGHTSLRPGQGEVIGRVLNGTNTLAVLPTGGGKSLCYQFPAVCLEGLTLVVSPLIALMRDQVDVLLGKGVTAARLDSTTTEEGHERTMAQLVSGGLKLLYLSPERLEDAALVKLLKGLDIALVAIDEAHCISEWGHSFRPSYLKLPKLVRALKPGVVLALTATASAATVAEIRKAFRILKRDQIQTSFYRENLSFDVTVCAGSEKRGRLLEVLGGADRVPGIVYARRRGDVEELASFLTSNGIPARAYHAGMPADARAEVQDGFVRHEFPVICATIAFGMGVDMPDVRSVIHYHPPKSPEGWIQESGRAGRDGRPGHCELLLNGDDRTAMESMVMAGQPGRKAVEAVVRSLFSQGERAMVSRYDLSTLNDIPVELLDVMLARLETAGWFVRDGASWMWCRVVPLRWDAAARQRMLGGFSKHGQSLLAGMLDSRKRVNLLELAGREVVKMNRLVGMLRELEAAGEVRLDMSHSLVHYRIKRWPEKFGEVVDLSLDAFREHARHDLARVEAVFDMATSGKCIAASLVGYFGEKLAQPCGRCAACVGKVSVRELPVSEVEEVRLEELEMVQAVVRERRAALSSPHRLARFLCGVYSPAVMRYRLYKHEAWGMLGRLPFEDVLGIARVVVLGGAL